MSILTIGATVIIFLEGIWLSWRFITRGTGPHPWDGVTGFVAAGLALIVARQHILIFAIGITVGISAMFGANILVLSQQINRHKRSARLLQAMFPESDLFGVLALEQKFLSSDNRRFVPILYIALPAFEQISTHLANLETESSVNIKVVIVNQDRILIIALEKTSCIIAVGLVGLEKQIRRSSLAWWLPLVEQSSIIGLGSIVDKQTMIVNDNLIWLDIENTEPITNALAIKWIAVPEDGDTRYDKRATFDDLIGKHLS